MIIDLGGIPVYRARIAFPRIGRWFAEIELQPSDTQPSTQSILTVTSDSGATAFSGSIDTNRSGVYLSSSKLRLVAGLGGWLQQTRPVHFAQGHTVGDILSAMLSSAGESGLSPTVNASLLGQGFTAYSVMMDSLASQVGVLVDVLNESSSPPIAHRFLSDGTFWIGVDAFSLVTSDFTLSRLIPEHNAAEIELSSPSVFPGQSILLPDGTTPGINHVLYFVDASGCRAEILFEDIA